MAQTHQFLVNLIYDPEYRGYVADVPQLPGCMSQGKTVGAAMKNVRKAIRVYLKATQSANVTQIPEVPTGRVKVSL